MQSQNPSPSWPDADPPAEPQTVADPSTVAEPQPAAAPPAPGRGTPGILVWFSIIAVVVLLAAGLGAFLILRTSVPSSADELAALLINPSGVSSSQFTTTTGADTLAGLPETAETGGLRWSVSRIWMGKGTGLAGALGLSQYETAEQAKAAFSEVTRGLSSISSQRAVPGYDDAVLIITPPNANLGAAAAGPILVIIFTRGQTAEATQKLLTDQLDRLP
jgi:hypothetical protein